MGLWERLRTGLRRRNATSPRPPGPTMGFVEGPANPVGEEYDGEEGARLRRRRANEQFSELLDGEFVDLDQLQRMAWNGVPQSRRRMVWMLLLGYMPPHVNRRDQTLRRKRGEFEEALKIHFDIPASSRSQRDQATLRQILVDVPRTLPGIPLFSQERIQNLMVRVLYVWSVRHPASGYVQGMNDLLAIIILVFATCADMDAQRSAAEAASADEPRLGRLSTFDSDIDDDLAPPAPTDESLPPSRRGPKRQPKAYSLDASKLSAAQINEIAADTYWCLSKVLDSIYDHYTHLQPGLRRATAHVEGLLRRVDSDLFGHLENECMPMLQITFRWINCLLTRELPLAAIIRLWDTCLAEDSGFDKFFPYVCAAFLCHFSETLRRLQAEDLHLFLQDLPTKDWTDDDVETLLSEAYILSTLFMDAPSHLTLGSGNTDMDPTAGTG